MKHTTIREINKIFDAFIGNLLKKLDRFKFKLSVDSRFNDIINQSTLNIKT